MKYRVRLLRSVVMDAFVDIDSDDSASAEEAALDVAMCEEWREIDSGAVTVVSSSVVADENSEEE